MGDYARGFAVALRKESVDRNHGVRKLLLIVHVALRKESVDRNEDKDSKRSYIAGRSPQGERG